MQDQLPSPSPDETPSIVHLTTADASRQLTEEGLPTSPQELARLAREKRIAGAIKVRSRWRIPVDYVVHRRTAAQTSDVPAQIQSEDRKTRVGYLLWIALTAVALLGIVSVVKDGLDLKREYWGSWFNGHQGDIALPRGVSAGLFITKILEPPGPVYDTSSTDAWLRSIGSADYTVSSVRIIHHQSTQASGVQLSGAVPIDARYVFSYTIGTDSVFALDPALRLDPHDSREVRLRVTLIPTASEDDDLDSGLSLVSARVNYHASDASAGTLLLATPCLDGVVVSRIIAHDVLCIADLAKAFTQQNRWILDLAQVDDDSFMKEMLWGLQAVTSDGWQRGIPNDVEPGTSVFYYPLEFDGGRDTPWNVMRKDSNEAFMPTRRAFARFVGFRKGINRSMSSSMIDDIVNILQSRSPDSIEFKIAVDLCSGVPDVRCENGLVGAASQQPDIAGRILNALVVRHAIWPSDTLASYILENAATLENGFSCIADNGQRMVPKACGQHAEIHDAIAAMSRWRHGDWKEALATLTAWIADGCDYLVEVNLEDQVHGTNCP